MRRKLRLDVDRLAVESFTAEEGAAESRGTVRAAQQGIGGCTYWESCDCWTAYYRCVEFMFTDYSCDYDTTGPRVTPLC